MMHRLRRFGVLWAGLALIASVLVQLGAGAALAGSGPIPGGVRLVMVETAACIYCIRWHKEIGPAYPLSEQGIKAPLTRREIGDSSLSGFRKVVYTPTFILVRDGQEIDRLTGYPGPDFFWSELDRLLEQLEPPPPAPPAETRVRY